MGRTPGYSDTAALAWEIVQAHPEGIMNYELARELGYRNTHSLGSILTTLGLNYPVYVEGKRIFAVREGDEGMMNADEERKIYVIKLALMALRNEGIEAQVVRIYGGMDMEVVISLPGVRAEWFTSTPTLPLKGEGEEVRYVDGLSNSVE